MLKQDRRLPEPDRIRVWRLDAVAIEAAVGERLFACLDTAEQARCERYRVADARRDFLVGRAGVRLLLGEALGCAPAAVPLVADDRGKPQLPAADGRHVNYSHSQGRVLLALARSPVGVDIQVQRPVGNQAALVRRYFSAAEITEWEAASDRDLAFFRGWTRKEAVAKADGRGLGLGLTSFSVSLEEESPSRVQSDTHPELGLLRVWDLDVGPGWTAALAGSGSCAGIEELGVEAVAGMLAGRPAL